MRVMTRYRIPLWSTFLAGQIHNLYVAIFLDVGTTTISCFGRASCFESKKEKSVGITSFCSVIEPDAVCCAIWE